MKKWQKITARGRIEKWVESLTKLKQFKIVKIIKILVFLQLGENSTRVLVGKEVT